MDLLEQKVVEFFAKLMLAAKNKDDEKIHQLFSLRLDCPECKKTFIARDGIDKDKTVKGMPRLRCPYCNLSLIE